jgi:hypothetical protein
MKWKPSLVVASVLAGGLLLGGLHAITPSRLTGVASEQSDRPAGQTGSPSPPDGAPSEPAGTSSGPEDTPKYRTAWIPQVPHVKQKPDFCGEACAAMVLAQLGYPINQDDVFDQSGVDPELGRGCYTRELWRALTRIGFHVGPVWYSVRADRAEAELERHFRALHADLASGVPSILCTHYDDQPDTTEHFRLILGYDAKTDEVLYHEPAVAEGAYRRMARQELLKLWPLKYDEDRWTLIRLRLQPGTIRNVHSTAKFTDADYAQRVIRLKDKAPEGFSIVVQKPFVVLGDESAAVVRRRSRNTIHWAVERLKREYFTKDPDEILDIWLFKDEESYTKHTAEVFGDWPHTPFGYYSHQHRALIMNIDTGGGTLVHEIVHPFIASNFPQCPAWFNEGLASLYEQCGDRGGRIWGYTNWRLEGLQTAIAPEEEESGDEASEGGEPPDGESDGAAEEPEARPEVPSFKTLCSTTTYQFYSEDPGTNYSQARYLCYYLQQRGLLREYYHRFRRNVQDDPTGYETLKAMLGIETEEGMEKFQEVWEAWVLKLRFP